MSDVPRELTLAGESLVVLTRDAALADTLKVLGTEHEILTVSHESDLPDALLGKHGGVAILDAAATSSPIEDLTQRLRGQFPDLVLIVAGRLNHQSALTAQITQGTIYRFLHKPVSEQRVKLFVEAAWRRHGEHPAALDDMTAMTGSLPVARPGLPRNTMIVGGILLCALVVAGGWFMTRGSDLRTPASSSSALEARPAVVTTTRDSELETLLVKANEALAAGKLVAPPGESAADLYRQARQRNPSDPRAAAGIESVISKLASAAEDELAAHHNDEAQKLIEQARAVQPDHVRVAFLAAQLAKEHERAVLTQARQAASNGNVQQAIAVLDGAARAGQRSTLVAETRAEMEQKQSSERVSQYLQLAADRMKGNQLLEPAGDSARFYVEAAKALGPDDAAVRQAQRQLAGQLTTAARAALSAGNPDDAQRWIQAATDAGAPQDDINVLLHEQQRVQVAAKADSMARLTLLFNQRVSQGRILDPPSDSAKFYLTQLMQADATHPSTTLAKQVMANRALDEAKSAVARQDFDAAQHWLTEAHDAGADDASTEAVQADIRARQVTATQATATKGAETAPGVQPERTHYVAPVFPAGARERGISGWVDVKFTIQLDGNVANVVVSDAQPAGVFEQSAINAVSKWRFRPVLRDGQPVTQRAELRVKFALEN